MIAEDKLNIVREGTVIPASPLALNSQRQFDERRQQALMRYYIDAGAGGVAVGMHFTQFAIRRPGIDLFEPVLRLCAQSIDEHSAKRGKDIVKIAGIDGLTGDAVKQAELARELGYDFVIVSLAAHNNALPEEWLHHMKTIASIIPVFGFYLLTGVGGIHLPYRFWRELVEIDNIYGIKIAPFNRYFTLDVCRAVAEAGKEEAITLYTGNDDSIIYDLLTPYVFDVNGEQKRIHIKGGLLGQWACWTQKAVGLLEEVKEVVRSGASISPDWLTRSAQITDANAALFDPSHGYAGSIPGVNEVLRRQGLMEGIWTLDHDEVLSPGQLEEIDRVYRSYPHLTDDAFVREHLDEWLA